MLTVLRPFELLSTLRNVHTGDTLASVRVYCGFKHMEPALHFSGPLLQDYHSQRGYPLAL